MPNTRVYDKYKDSGIEWIGEIPQNWRLSKYKYFAHSGMGDTILAEQLVGNGIPVYSATQEEKIFGYVTHANTILKKGDLVIPARGNSIGCVTYIKDEIATCTQTTIYSKLNNICNKYLFYCCYGLKDNWFEYDDTAIPQITVKQIKNNPLPLPNKQEQQEIADYLDKKCEEIDISIETQKNIIKKLKEYKQSVITETVTKGLDKSVPLKDSGVEWIGKIPKHWEICKIKNYINLKTGTTPSSRNTELLIGDYNWFTPVDFNENIVLSNSARKINITAKEENIVTSFPINTVFIIGIGATTGKIGFSTVEGSCNQQITAMLPKSSNILSKFLLYWMLANSCFIRETALFTTLPIINNTTLGQYLLLKPQIKEQQQIVEYLDSKCTEINNTITDKERLIEKLTEYKKSLIYECVTGKRKVVT